MARAIQPFLSAVARGDSAVALLGAAADDAIIALDRVRHEAEFEAQRKDAAASAESDEFVRRYRYGF